MAKGTSQPDNPKELSTSPPYVCPECGDEKTRIGMHYSMSKHGYPSLSDEDKHILTGLYLSGAHITDKSSLRKVSWNWHALRDLYLDLGHWATSVMKFGDPKTDLENILNFSARETNRTTQKWRLTIRKHPWIDNALRGSSPSDLPFTPTAARILFSFRGGRVHHRHLFIFSNDPYELRRTLRANGYKSASVQDREHADIVLLSESDSASFLNYIGDTVLSGYEYKIDPEKTVDKDWITEDELDEVSE